MPTSKTASCFQLGVRFPDGSLQTTAATGGSLKVNGISVAAPNLIDSASVTFSVVGSNISLAASGTVTSFSASTLSPLFTTSVATATTTPALTFSLSNAAGGTVFGNNITGAAGPAFTIAPVLGIPGTSTGSIALASSTASGKFTITAPASTSTPTLTLPITSNVLAGQFAGDGVIFNSILNTASAAGTLTPTLLTQTAYYVLAGPGTAGPAATPTFRALVAGDIPPLSGLYLPLAGGTMTGVLTLEASAAGLKDAAGSAGATGNLLTINASGYPIWTAPATSGTVTSFSAGNLSPLFTTSVATATTTPALTFALSNAAAGTVLGNATGSAAGPGYTATPVLGLNTSVAGTLGLATSVAAGATITLQNLGALTAYNFNLPLAVGATGSVLTSQAGGSSAMTWTTQAGLAVAWSSFVAATASLTLNNAAYTTTFNQTSAANWTWANTTAATSAQYSKYITYTINSAQITGTLSNFPVLISGTIADLATVAHGGLVQNASGYDIIFSSTNVASGAGILNFEMVSYNATTGAFAAYVQIPSAAVGTAIYILFGNNTISSSQQNVAATWNNGFLGVWHFGTSSSLVLKDSTGNSTATNHGGTATAGPGAAGGALALASASSQWVDTGNLITGLNAFTVEAWLQPAAFDTYFPLSNRSSASTNGIFLLTSGWASVGYGNGGFFYQECNTNPPTSSFNYIAGAHTASASNAIATYYNGASSVGSTGSSGTQTTVADSGVNVNFGKEQSSLDYYNGAMAEVRISNVARTAAWIAATYNNQNAPSSFGAFGSTQSTTAIATNQSSPNLILAGTYWNGSASAADNWTTQVVIANVVSGASTLAFTHTGSAGTASVSVPNLSVVGTVISYDGNATVKAGVPSILAAPTKLTGQQAAQSAVSIVASAAAGTWRISYVAYITQVDTVSSVLGGVTGFAVNFTDPDDSVAKTSNPTTPTISAANTTGTTVSGNLYVYAKAATAITYNFGYTTTGSGATAMSYSIAVYAEYLG